MQRAGAAEVGAAGQLLGEAERRAVVGAAYVGDDGYGALGGQRGEVGDGREGEGVADDLKAEERKVTTALEQAADVADRAAKVLATRPETDAAELRKAEDAMCERDEGVRLVAEQRNALETCVLELRAAKNGTS